MPLPGALAMVDIPGTTLDADTAAHLRRYGIQSVCLFGKNVESPRQLRALCSDLRDLLGEGALIALDHEGGAILRPNFWPFAPSAMNSGAADDPALTEQVHAALARQLRSVGINWNFAPVLDVNVNPANPVISERAFGGDPALVARQGRASLRGHATAGVAGCVKHFPGHGDTHLDSHYALPRVKKSRAELEAVELATFRELLPVTPAVMTAHIIFDALDDQYPATLSRPILTGLLRQEWGYDGVIVTDSMGMKAIDDNYGRGEAGVLTLEAGADLVMALGRREAQEATLDAIAQAMQSGRLSLGRVQESQRRLRELAAQYPAQADPDLHPEEDAGLMRRAWAQGLTEYRNPSAPAPGSRVTLVAQSKVGRENVSEASVDAGTLASELSEHYDVTIHAYETPDELDWNALHAAGQPIILITAHRHRQAALNGATPDLHIALYNPFTAFDVNAPALLAYGFRPEARAAVWDWLQGRLTANGQLPFNAPSSA